MLKKIQTRLQDFTNSDPEPNEIVQSKIFQKQYIYFFK